VLITAGTLAAAASMSLASSLLLFWPKIVQVYLPCYGADRWPVRQEACHAIWDHFRMTARSIAITRRPENMASTIARGRFSNRDGTTETCNQNHTISDHSTHRLLHTSSIASRTLSGDIRRRHSRSMGHGVFNQQGEHSMGVYKILFPG